MVLADTLGGILGLRNFYGLWSGRELAAQQGARLCKNLQTHMRGFASLICLMLVGCATSRQPEVGQVDVHVPKMFRHGVGWFLDVPTDYERYLDMFRRGYWQCIENYAEDINYVNKPSDSIACGWGSEVSGYADGYRAAEGDMSKNMKRFGKDRTAKYLRSIWQDGG